MITFYKADETDFDNNGLGVLDHDIQNPDIEEKLNDIFTFSFNYPIFAVNGSRLAARMIVKADDPENEGQLFRIMKLSKSNGMLTAFCYHIFYDLNGNEIPDTNIVGQNGQTAITQMLSKTAVAHKFQGFSDIAETANIRVVRMSPVKFLIDPQTDNNFINRLGGEIRRVNYRIWMNKARGSDNGATIRWKKSLDSYNATWDYTTIATRIRPVGYNGIMLPESYVDSPLIDKYETIVIKEIQYSDIKAIDPNATSNDETAVPLEQAYELLRQAAAKEFSENNLDKPTVTLSVNMVALRNMDEYKDVKSLETINPWDTVTVINERDGLSVKVRLNHYHWNPVTHKFISMELGNAKSTFTDIGSKVDHATNIANQANDTANTAAESANGKNSNYYGPSEPSRPVDGDLWYKKNGDKTELWQYDGKSVPPGWKLVVDDATGEEVRQNVDAAQKEAEEAKKTANESVAAANGAVAKAGFANDTATQAKSDAAEAGQQAKDALTNAGTAITDAQKALTNSSSAQADSAQARKDSAAAAADAVTAKNDAATALTDAKKALTDSSSAMVDSAQARKDSATAKIQAANAATQANQAVTDASTAKADANTAKANATQAINNAANALDKFNNMKVGGRNLYLNSKAIEDIYGRSGGATVTVEPFDSATNMWHIVAAQGTGHNVGIYLNNYADNKLPDTTDWSYSADIKGTGKLYIFGIEVGGRNPVVGTVGTEWSRISQTGHFDNADFKTIIMYFDTNSGPVDAYIKLPKLEIGNTPTDWSPAPEDVQQKFTDINGELANKVSQTTYNTLAGTVDTVSTLAKQNQSTIGTLATKTSVDTVSKTATTAQTLAQQNANELLNKASSTTVNTLTQRVTTAESTLSQTATKAELGLTKTDVDKLGDSVASQALDIAATADGLKLKADSSTVSSLDGRVTNISGQLDVQADKIAATVTANDVTGMLNGYATETWTQNQINLTADGINGTISSVKSTVDGQTTSINDLKADSSGFKAQFTTVNNTIGKQTTDIGTLQATSKELTTGFNTLTTDNGTNKNDISQLKQTAIEVTSTLETVQTQVQDSSVGTNLLLDSQARVQEPSWFSKNWSWIEDWGTYLGSNIRRTPNSWDNDRYSYKDLLDRGVINTTDDFTYSIYFRVVGEDPAGMSYANIVFLSDATTKIGFVPLKLTNLKEGQWTRVVVTFKFIGIEYDPTKDYNYSIRVEASNVPRVAGAYYEFAAPKLEKGSAATDYSVNPEDTATVTATSKISQTVEGMKTDISKKIEQSDLNGYATETWTQNQIQTTAGGITGTLSSVKTTVDGHETSINELKADSGSFKSQFTTVNGTLEKQSTDIGTLQASSKSLSASFDSLSSDNQTNQHNISQLQASAETFNSTLMTVQKQVTDSAVGTNLYTDTKNFDNPESWSGYGSWTKTTDTYNGLAVMQTTQDWNGLSQYIQVKKGDTLTYSAYAKNTSGTGTSDIFWAFNGNSEGYSAAEINQSISVVTITDSWQRISGTVVATSDGYLRPRLERGVQNSNVLQICGIKVEKGSVATDWCPNPSETATVTAFSKLSQTVNGIQTTVSDKADQSQVTQLAGQITSVVGDVSANSSQITQMKADINLRVKAGDVINQINISPESILIAGQKVHITGQTSIDNAVIKDAMIADIKADKITAGTLNAANVNVINLNANNITTGTIKGANLSLNLNTGEVVFQKGFITSADGNIRFDLDKSYFRSLDYNQNGFELSNGAFYLFNKGWNGVLSGSEQYLAGKITGGRTQIWSGMDINGSEGLDLSVYDSKTSTLGASISLGKAGGSGKDIKALNVTASDIGIGNNGNFIVNNYDGYFSVNSPQIELISTKQLTITGGLDVIGKKNAIHPTNDGIRETPAYETAESYLGDIGEGVTDESGRALIHIDALFNQIINTDYAYQVFISSYSNAIIWVEERNAISFEVHSNIPNAKFAWEIKAKRRGYETDRLVKSEMKYEQLNKFHEKKVSA
ncbi:phage tail spike protein [Latilactobacillus curvatus]|uniref:phage tail spike protein n=1 Tax=Latilactobacillus curvatus TaxID=28038 RepID=UPI0028B6D9C5|nr:phage tail spike protein [Latilactobacillus curvatus]MDT7016369.1 phage tail spike protein [Latilactobacillus curvatus]